MLLLKSGGAQLSIDNTCQTCTRPQNDSANLNIRKIRVNQSGYRPQDTNKKGVVANPNGTSFQVVDAENGSVAYTGDLTSLGNFVGGGMSIHGYYQSDLPIYVLTRDPAGENLYQASFSQLTTPGRYYMVNGIDTSATFYIHSNIYNQVFETSLKFFGVQRCGATNSWFHKDCHLKDGSALGAQYAGRLTGGWHDCGDHGKYSETLGYAALVLSLTYAIFPEKAEDFYGASYNDTLPFGTDGIPDLLWEAKVGADYIYKLYKVSKELGLIDNGDMYHSVGMGPGQDHQLWDVPEHQDQHPQSKGGPDRPVTAGIGSNVAGLYASTMAFFSWGWRFYDPEYADSLVAAAAEIYDKIILPRRGSSTIMPCCYPGGGQIFDDEAMAALSLLFVTKNPKYKFDLLDNVELGDNITNAGFNQGEFPTGLLGRNPFYHGGWVTDYEQVNAYVIYALAKLILKDNATAADYGITPVVRDSLYIDAVENIRRGVIDGSGGPDRTSYPGIGVHPPYNLVFTSFEWGLNRYNLGLVNDIFMMWDLTGENQYYEVGIDNMNYNLGLNSWDISFLMGTGDKNLQHPHNRAANPEGYNAGGIPYEYRCPKGALMGGADPEKHLIDKWDEWTFTETCTDFSAQMVLPSLMLSNDLPPDTQGPEMLDVRVVPEDIQATITWQLSEISRDTLIILDAPGGNVLFRYPHHELDLNKIQIATGLTPNTTYYFYFVSMDSRYNRSINDNEGKLYQFTTLNNAIPPEFSNVRVCNETHESAQVTWWTLNVPSTSEVQYGESEPLSQSKVGDDNGATVFFHSVTLDNLEPDTEYLYDVLSNGYREDSLGQHYRFRTTEVFVDYTIQIKPYKNDGTMFYLQITNNEDIPYAGLELRWYFSHPNASEVQNWEMLSDYKTLCDVTGCSGGFLDVQFSKAVAVPGHPDSYYFPITIVTPIGVADRAVMQLQIMGPNRTIVDLNNFTDAWSFRPHTNPPDPLYFQGIPLEKGGPNGVYTNSERPDELVDGKIEVSYTTTQYVTAYYKGVHVYGYGPDFISDPIARKATVYLDINQPFQTPESRYYVFDSDSLVTVSGRARSEGIGSVSTLMLNGQVVPPSQYTADSDTSITFNIPLVLKPGDNIYDLIAWNDSNCAFEAQNFIINRSVEPPKQVETPIAVTNPRGNQFGKAMEISLSTPTEGATIYYTLDGTPPNSAGGGSSILYVPGQPIVITETTQLQAIAVKDRWLPSAIFVGNYEKLIYLPSISSATAFDLDGDGRVETINIYYADSIGETPTLISSIDWPAESGADKSASGAMIKKLNDTLLQIDLSADPFPFGLTEISAMDPPYLTVEGGYEVLIEDGVGPILQTAEIRRADVPRFVRQGDPNLTILTNEDTLRLTFSEGINSNSLLSPLINNWFRFSVACAQDSGLFVPIKYGVTQTSNEPNTLVIPIQYASPDALPVIGDCITASTLADFTDAYSNKAMANRVIITGDLEGELENFYSKLLFPIITGTEATEQLNMPNVTGIPILNSDGIQVDQLKADPISTWIPPMYMEPNGEIAQELQARCAEFPRPDFTPRRLPQNCLSVIGIYSGSAYSADITIVDNLGKHIKSFTQTFGYCGEMQNPERLNRGGYASFLAWNLKNEEGKHVSSGVYIWKVVFKFGNGFSRTSIFRQGVAKNAPPLPNCALAE